MCSPRKKSFYLNLANMIHKERMYIEQARNDDLAEVHALQKRLLRLQQWEYLLYQPEVKAECIRRFQSEGCGLDV
jgi:phosphopantothenoylcysteine synthetase/decarboxylase